MPSHHYRVGPTGEFPDGKLDELDLGELVISIGVYTGTVLISMGDPVKALALTPRQARDVATTLVKIADIAERRKNS